MYWKPNPLLLKNCLVVPATPQGSRDGKERETHIQYFSQCLNLGKRRGFVGGSFRGLGKGSSPFLSYLNWFILPLSKANNCRGLRPPLPWLCFALRALVILLLLVSLSSGAPLSHLPSRGSQHNQHLLQLLTDTMGGWTERLMEGDRWIQFDLEKGNQARSWTRATCKQQESEGL